jgi:hypothetical protein
VIKEAFANSQTSQVGDPAANPTQAAMPKPDFSSIFTSMSAAKTPSPSPLSELDQWVSAERFLKSYGMNRAAPASSGSGRKRSGECCRTFAGVASFFIGLVLSWIGLISGNADRTV